MESKYAVYTVIVEDTERAFLDLTDKTLGWRLIEDEIDSFEIAEAISEDLTVL